MPAAAAGQGLLAIDRDVPDLAAGAKGARDELAVGDDARAHARAQGDEHVAGDLLRHASPHLAERRRVGVVDEGDRRVGEGGGQRAHHALGVELDVGEHAHRAVVGHGTGDVQAAGDDVVRRCVVGGKDLLDAAGHDRVRLLGHELGSGDLALLEKLARRGEEPRLDARPADVDAKNRFHWCLLAPWGQASFPYHR